MRSQRTDKRDVEGLKIYNLTRSESETLPREETDISDKRLE